MELRAVFLYARGDTGAELGAAKEGCLPGGEHAELELHTARCSGGLVTRTTSAHCNNENDEEAPCVRVQLRRERPGVFVCVEDALGVAFSATPGSPAAYLPLRLSCCGDVMVGGVRAVVSQDGVCVTFAVELAHEASGKQPQLGYELVLVGHDQSTQRPVCLGCTVPRGGGLVSTPAGEDQCVLAAFQQRTVSGRQFLSLEPIDENAKVSARACAQACKVLVSCKEP